MFENFHEWSDDQIKVKYLEIQKRSEERTVERAGTTNCYKCEDCGQVEKYIYIDSGVTPFFNTCNFCKGEAQSSFGRDILPGIPATMEWFRPGLEELLELKNSKEDKDHYQLEHYLNGGLESRKRFTGKNIIIFASARGCGGTARAELLAHLASFHGTPIIMIDSIGGTIPPSINPEVAILTAKVSDLTPLPRLPNPVIIPKINFPKFPKNRQQRRKEDRDNKNKGK